MKMTLLPAELYQAIDGLAQTAIILYTFNSHPVDNVAQTTLHGFAGDTTDLLEICGRDVHPASLQQISGKSV
jgi:hypothetical protein